MNTKALKTVMIVDEQSWGGGGRERGRGRTRGPPPCLLSVSIHPCLQEGAPPQSPEAWPEGEGTRAWGLGAQAPPSEAQGAGGKKGVGDYKSQETTKLNTNVGTAGKGRGRGREGRGPVQADCPSGLQGRKGHLRPCSRCSPDSAEASPGRCRRGARSPHSPSHSGDSSCSL